MPVMDGLAATAQIRAYELEHCMRRTPSILALTANAMTHQIETWAGGDGRPCRKTYRGVPALPGDLRGFERERKMQPPTRQRPRPIPSNRGRRSRPLLRVWEKRRRHLLA